MRKDRIMGSIRSSRGGGRRSVSINNNVDIVTGVSFTVNASSSLIYKTLDDAEKLKIQLVRGVKFHGFFVVIPNYSYEIDRDRSFERVSKTHSHASSIPEFLRAHAPLLIL